MLPGWALLRAYSYRSGSFLSPPHGDPLTVTPMPPYPAFAAGGGRVVAEGPPKEVGAAESNRSQKG